MKLQFHPVLSRRLTLAALASTWLVSGTASADVAPDPPSVEITSPVDGAMLMGDPAVFDVEVDVFSGDSGVSEVQLTLNGETVATSIDPPFTFTGVEAPVGMHTLVAIAVEVGSGRQYPSQAVTIAVLAGGGTADGTAGGTAGDGSTGPGGGDTDDPTTASTSGGGEEPPPAEEPSGCATASGTTLGGASAMLGLLLMGIGRRRRRR